MAGVWIGGFPFEFTRPALVRWAASDVKDRIGRDIGEDAIKSPSIGNNSTVVLGTHDDAIVLARFFRVVPPRWTGESGGVHLLRARRDRSGTQLATGRALGALYGEIEEHMASAAIDAGVTLRVEPIRLAFTLWTATFV